MFYFHIGRKQLACISPVDNIVTQCIIPKCNHNCKFKQFLNEDSKSIIFFGKNSNSLGKLALRLRICVSFAAIYNVERVAVLTMTWTWSYVRSIRTAMVVYSNNFPNEIKTFFKCKLE